MQREQLLSLVQQVTDLLLREPSHVQVPSNVPILFAGDTHGDADTTQEILTSFWPSHRLVFCGDYVDRAPETGGSLDNVVLLFRAKLKAPDQIILLRGNHEFRRVFRDEGFGDTLLEFGDDDKALTRAFEAAFSQLPYVASTAHGIIALHGGLPNLSGLDGLLQLPKGVLDFLENQLVSQTVNNDNVLSADDLDVECGFCESPRVHKAGFSLCYGEPYFSNKMKTCQARVLVRGHDFRVKGYSLDDRVLTLMSCRQYADQGPVPGILLARVDPQGAVRTARDLELFRL